MELKSCDLLFWLEQKNGEGESAKRSNCGTVHGWVEIIILINITLA